MAELQQYLGEEIIYTTPSSDCFEVPQEAINHAIKTAKSIYPNANLCRLVLSSNDDKAGNKKYIAIVYTRVSEV